MIIIIYYNYYSTISIILLLLLWRVLKAERDVDSATVSFERQCVKWEADTLPTDSDADQETTRLWQLGRASKNSKI